MTFLIRAVCITDIAPSPFWMRQKVFVCLAFNQKVFLSSKQPTIPKYHKLKKTGDYFDCTVQLVLSVKTGKQVAKGKSREVCNCFIISQNENL